MIQFKPAVSVRMGDKGKHDPWDLQSCSCLQFSIDWARHPRKLPEAMEGTKWKSTNCPGVLFFSSFVLTAIFELYLPMALSTGSLWNFPYNVHLICLIFLLDIFHCYFSIIFHFSQRDSSDCKMSSPHLEYWFSFHPNLLISLSLSMPSLQPFFFFFFCLYSHIFGRMKLQNC